MGGSEIKIYELWRKYATDDVDLIHELDKIENDKKAIEDWNGSNEHICCPQGDAGVL